MNVRPLGDLMEEVVVWPRPVLSSRPTNLRRPTTKGTLQVFCLWCDCRTMLGWEINCTFPGHTAAKPHRGRSVPRYG